MKRQAPPPGSLDGVDGKDVKMGLGVNHEAVVLDADSTETSPRPAGSPMRQAVLNLWLLAIMGGFLAIICVSSTRFTLPQPGADWYVTEKKRAQHFSLILIMTFSLFRTFGLIPFMTLIS